MRYIPHTGADVARMLDAIGVTSIEELFECVPAKLRLRGTLALPPALSEQELFAELGSLAERNANTGTHDWFLGAGTYAHFTPSAVDALASRAE